MRRQQKIYDAGGERIVSQELTRSYGDANVDRGDYADAPHMDYAALRTSMEYAVKKAYEQLGVHYEGSDTVAAMTKPRKAGDLPGDSAVGEETRRFFYHKDHLGGTSIVTDKDGNAVQRLTYLPYGEVFTDALVDSSFVSPYKFTGKELDEETGLYYFGARYYNPRYSLWYGTDPLQEKYPGVSAYAYCMGNPVNTVDPDGRLMIFINGQHGGSGGSSAYWSGLDKILMNNFNDHKHIYYDGALGGWSATFSWHSNLSQSNRREAGREKGLQQASYLMSKLSEGEKIRVVTHSMGAAYAKGFIEGFIEYVQSTMEIAKASDLFEFELDLAPFQPTQQNAVKDVKTYVVQHKYDLTAGTKKLPGAERKKTGREDVIMHDKSFLYQGFIEEHSVESFTIEEINKVFQSDEK